MTKSPIRASPRAAVREISRVPRRSSATGALQFGDMIRRPAAKSASTLEQSGIVTSRSGSATAGPPATRNTKATPTAWGTRGSFFDIDRFSTAAMETHQRRELTRLVLVLSLGSPGPNDARQSQSSMRIGLKSPGHLCQSRSLVARQPQMRPAPVCRSGPHPGRCPLPC